MDLHIPLGRIDKMICRVCLQERGTVLLHGTTEEMFQYCTLLKGCKDENLPRKLCTACAKNLRVAYDFRFQAIYADKYLRVTLLGNRNERNIKERTEMLHIDRKSKIEPSSNVEQLEVDVEQIEEIVVVQSDNNTITLDATRIETDMAIEMVEDEHQDTEFITQDESDDNMSDHFAEYFTTTENGIGEQSQHTDEPATIIVESMSKDDKADDEKDDNANISATAKDKYECNICGAVCAQMYSLKQHYMIHCGERPFICEFCDKAFTRPGVLRNHRRKHTGNLPYQCTECAVSFANRIWLDRHKNREHSIEVDSMNRREYKCNKCPNVYNSKYTLNAHLRLQHPPERIKMQLAKHAMMLVENEETVIDETVLEPKLKPIMYQESLYSMGEFLCSMCPATFTRQFKLIEHLLTHDNPEIAIATLLTDENATKLSSEYSKERKGNKNVPEQTYTCDCGKTFTRKATMHLHRQLRCTVGPYQCVCCDEMCHNIRTLKAHLIEAHEEHFIDQLTPIFKCFICDVSTFATFAAFVNHLDVHDTTKVYQCEYCVMKFTKKYNYLYHVKAVHEHETLKHT